MNTEVSQIGDIDVEIVRKKIKNLHIGCYPPEGRVRVAVPEHLSDDAIRLAVLTRMPWIRRKQAHFLKQERQPPRRYVFGETHYLFGRPVRLEVQEWNKKVHRFARQGSDRLRVNVPEGSDPERLRRWMEAWMKAELRRWSAPRVEYWSARMDAWPRKWGIRLMKTKWRSCNANKRIIWLNSELAKKLERTIDYVIVHELAHLVSPKHDRKFTDVMDWELQRWRNIRQELNELPLAAWTD